MHCLVLLILTTGKSCDKIALISFKISLMINFEVSSKSGVSNVPIQGSYAAHGAREEQGAAQRGGLSHSGCGLSTAEQSYLQL